MSSNEIRFRLINLRKMNPELRKEIELLVSVESNDREVYSLLFDMGEVVDPQSIAKIREESRGAK